MGFLDSLRKTFIYSGNNLDDSEKEIDIIEDGDIANKFRIDVTNPLKRAKSFKGEATKIFSSLNSNDKKVISIYTKNLIYDSMHKEVEYRVKKNKPNIEARILYKRFIEDQITDEAVYSDEDLLYIKSLVSVIRELKAGKFVTINDREEIINQFLCNKFLLHMCEVLDVKYGYNFMEYACNLSYIICGYSYNGALVSSDKMNLPYFVISIEEMKFAILNEVKSLISEESSDEDKLEYIVAKIAPFFNRYCIINEVPLVILSNILWLFREPVIDEESMSVVKKETIKNMVVEESVTINSLEDEFEINTPVEVLKFINLYGGLADPRNSSVSIEELEESISDIEEIMKERELTMEEFKIYKSLMFKLKLREGSEL